MSKTALSVFAMLTLLNASHRMFRRLDARVDLIDINAGTIATGEATIEEVGMQIFQMILDVASGRHQTWADHWGLSNDLALFNPAPVT